MNKLLLILKTKKYLFLVIIAIGILIYFIIQSYITSNELKENGIYTVGEVTGIRNGSKGAKYLQYKYKVDDNIYKGEYGEIYNAQKGHKYLVLYSKEKVYLNVIYPNKLMDSIELGSVIGKYTDLKLPIKTWEMPHTYNSPPD